MEIIYKQMGETPLGALELFRAKNSGLKNEKISYIGRLDPLAEGEMILLIGKSENQDREKYLELDKEYEADFLFGFKTDTGDLMGLVEKTDFEADESFQKNDFGKIREDLLKIKEQKYPWFSSKHVKGRALFDWFKSGQKDEIERPVREIEILEIGEFNFEKVSGDDLLTDIKSKIFKVSGYFRQEEILKKWQDIFDFRFDSADAYDFPILKFKIKVSSGTYIRALTEFFEEKTGIPCVLSHLKRSKIFL